MLIEARSKGLEFLSNRSFCCHAGSICISGLSCYNYFIAGPYDVIDRLPNIQIPTLVLCGEHDWICPPSHSRLIASRIPGAKLVMVPNASHAVPADVANREIRQFLTDNPGLSLPRKSEQ